MTLTEWITQRVKRVSRVEIIDRYRTTGVVRGTRIHYTRCRLEARPSTEGRTACLIALAQSDGTWVERRTSLRWHLPLVRGESYLTCVAIVDLIFKGGAPLERAGFLRVGARTGAVFLQPNGDRLPIVSPPCATVPPETLRRLTPGPNGFLFDEQYPNPARVQWDQWAGEIGRVTESLRSRVEAAGELTQAGDLAHLDDARCKGCGRHAANHAGDWRQMPTGYMCYPCYKEQFR